MNISNAAALVTGANRGIGRALVVTLLDAGVRKLYAASRSGDTTGLPADTRIVGLTVDITDRSRVDRIASEATDVTLLVNNAGVLDFGDIVATPIEAVVRNFETNFYGTLHMARAFAPTIEQNGGGAIVNILTLVALASMPGLAVYNASKAAAWSMTQSLRANLAEKGIAVHGVFPGAVDTDMLAGVDMPKANPTEVARAIVSGIAEGQEDIFPDSMSAELYSAWRQDHKAVERQFAAM